MDHKEAVYDHASRAPEVASSYYAPIPAYRDSEGLQVSYDDTNGKEAIADERSASQGEQAAAHYGEAAIAPRPRKWYRRKRWWIAIVLLFLAVVAAAVGAGIGASSSSGGEEAQSGRDGQSNAQDEGQGQGQDGSQSTPSPTASPNSASSTSSAAIAPASTSSASSAAVAPASTSSTSSAAVAPATSGIADYSCTNGTYTYSAQPAGLAYIEQCNTFYAYNSPSIFSEPSGLIAGLFSSTKYSFQACVDSCDDWNGDNPSAEAPCRAVSYYANLTNVFSLHESWGGNCILKSGVGGVTTNNTDDSTADYALTASAYRACLQQGTPCNSSS